MKSDQLTDYAPFAFDSNFRATPFEGDPANVKRLGEGLVFKAHKLVYHSALGMGGIRKRRKRVIMPRSSEQVSSDICAAIRV